MFSGEDRGNNNWHMYSCRSDVITLRLSNDGMEIQCILKFTGDKMMMNKARQGTVIHAEQSLILKKVYKSNCRIKICKHATSHIICTKKNLAGKMVNL